MYEQYKNINLPWLNEIPYHWDIHRNKNIFTEMKEEVGADSEQYRLLSLTLNGIIPRNMNGGGKFPGSFDKYKVVKPGYMVFCLFDVDETPRTVGLSEYDGMLTGAYTIMKVHDVNARYVYYYYLALDNQKMLRPLYTGLRKTINVNRFQSMKIPIPPRAEQDQIVRFLDWKVSAINRLIGIKRKQEALLKEQEQKIIARVTLKGLRNYLLKDSGNKWIKEIPVHWKITKLGTFCRFQNGISESGEFFSSGKPFVSYGDVYKHLELPQTVSGMAKSDEVQQEQFSVRCGDIFFTRTSENIEEIGMAAVCKQTIDKAVFSGFLIRCRPKNNIVDTDYMKYYLQTVAIRNHFSSTINIVTRASLGQSTLKEMPVIIPPMDEQKQIVSFLDSMHTKYVKLEGDIHREIDILSELKTRLIADTVTGKIDVRNIEIPEYEFVGEESQAEKEIDADGIENEK